MPAMPLVEARDLGALPARLEAAHPAVHEHDVQRSVPDHLVGDREVAAGDVAHGAVRCPSGCRRRRRGLVLTQHRQLEGAELGRRLDAQLLVERRAERAVRRQRVGLAAGAVQREHEQPPGALAQRVRRDEPLELGHERAVLAAGQVGVDAVLQGAEAQVLQARALTGRERLAELGERRPAPQRQGVVQAPRRAQLVEAPEVGRAVQDVARRAGLQRTGRQHLAQLRDGDVDHLHGRRRLVLAPQVLEQRVDRDGPPGLEREPGEQRALPRPAEADGRAVVADLQRPEDEDVRGQSRDPIPLDRCLAFGA